MPRNGRATLRLVDLSGDPPGEVLLFRAGVNKSYKGLLLFDEEAARRVLADFETHGAELFFDYDHASLFGFSKGAGEAAAWFRPEVREGALWAVDVRWTEEAAEKVRARKYRYISPAVDYELDSNRITRLINVALTNLPASHGLPPLMAASQGAKGMLEGALAHIASALGLDPDSASEDDVIKAFDDHMTEDGGDEGDDALKDSDAAEALAQIRTLTGKATTREALAAAAEELQAARAAAVEDEIGALVDRGIAAKLIPAAGREAFVKLGRKDLEALRELVGSAGEDPERDKPKKDPPKDAPPKKPAAKPSPPATRYQQASLAARTRRNGEFDLQVAKTLRIDPAAMDEGDD
ncbi:phage protease [Polyangium sp. 15x6]|uniref:phage protease n=1 Tax=Polyangium sp. 15x6 TaxID=3042687 RepID=UPI00249AD214|nr:phage protease [Polyangium sp. 15x6]MDI3291837.1 phage protease [Polyangium sp. 15x6]